MMVSKFVGPDEIESIDKLRFASLESVPMIPYTKEILEEKRENYYLILGINSFSDGTPVTIRNMQKIFGKDPEVSEPCFYNQDWYEKEDFIDNKMKYGWYLIRSNIFEDSRAIQPDELNKRYTFPDAITCTYSFFIIWLTKGVKLWYHDFIWCSDTDHNGDRIYVGKYHDIDGVNKNGFSIHRHLALRPCYGCID